MKSSSVIVCFLGTFLVVKSSFGQQDIVASLNSLSVPAKRVSVTPPPKPILKVAVYFPEQSDLSILLSAEKVTTEVFRRLAELPWCAVVRRARRSSPVQSSDSFADRGGCQGPGAS